MGALGAGALMETLTITSGHYIGGAHIRNQSTTPQSGMVNSH